MRNAYLQDARARKRLSDRRRYARARLNYTDRLVEGDIRIRANVPNAGKFWTKEEDHFLMSYDMERGSRKDCAERLGRSVESIRKRKKVLKRKRRKERLERINDKTQNLRLT